MNAGLVVQGHLLLAIEFMFHHPDCFYDVILLSSVSIFFIVYFVFNLIFISILVLALTRKEKLRVMGEI